MLDLLIFCKFCPMRYLCHVQKLKKMVQDLLSLKANWREFCDHLYFRDLTSIKDDYKVN